MKIRRLSEIDLARFVTIPKGPQLDQALRNYDAGGGAWPYDPVRASTADILGAKTPLYGPLPPLGWGKIEKQIEAACRKGDEQKRSNVQVGKVLFDESRRLQWKAVKLGMGQMPIGIGETVRYWSDLVLGDEDGAFIPFFDHRRANGIASREAKQIVFSMQNIWVRERHPDLVDARLAVVRFPVRNEMRTMRIEFANEAELLTYEELDIRVRDVYEAWARVTDERKREPAKTGTGGNPFNF